MQPRKTTKYRDQLLDMAARLRGDIASLEDQARAGTGGDAGGNLSNTPLHLADLGTENYMQELNATLLENEEYLGAEVAAALTRVDDGSYGKCERCGKPIPEERLELLPYARHCTPCAEAVQSGLDVNLDDGRQIRGGFDLEARRAAAMGEGREGRTAEERHFYTEPDAPVESSADVHAVGTPGGGSALGGLAGTNIGEGDPDDGNLEAAMGSSEADLDPDDGLGDDDELDEAAYSGPSGGAVGGTPANKRSTGGRAGREG